MKTEIRKATLEDWETVRKLLAQIAQLHHEGRPDLFKSGASKYKLDEYREILGNENKPVFVAVGAETGEVVGHVFCEMEDHAGHPVFTPFKTLHIDDLCVDEALRGQGIGRRLFEYVKNYAERENCRSISLDVWQFNENSVKFYESMGMTTQKRRMELAVETRSDGRK